MRINAIDWQEAPRWEEVHLSYAFLYNWMRQPVGGGIACYLSHRRAWELIAASGHPQALVFEDDAIPESFSPQVLSEDLYAYGLDVLRLEEMTLRGGARLATRKFEISIAGRKAVGVPTFGGAAYIVTADGIEKLLKPQKFWFYVDHFDIWERLYGVRTAVLRPNMFRQSGSSSDIATLNAADQVRGKSPSTTPARLADKLASQSRSVVSWITNALLDVVAFLPRQILLTYLLLKKHCGLEP